MLKYTLVIAFIVTLGLIGRSDYKNEVYEDTIYVQMVCDGFYPNYKDIELTCDTSGDNN
jgi:hypothetical protein